MLKNLVNLPDWEEAKEIIEQKMVELALDFPEQSTQQVIAIHALANKKAYKFLKDWLKEMEFHTGEERTNIKRDMR